MKYAFRDGDRTLVVVAASSLTEFVDFQKAVEADTGRFADAKALSFVEMEMDPRFRELQQPPIVIEFRAAAEIDAFAAEAEITISGPNRAIGFVRPMMLGNRDTMLSETRTIAEMLGIDKVDPWDKRTPEQKAAEEERKKKVKDAYDKAKAAGTLSGDSFAAPEDSGVHVTDISAITDKDGKIQIDSARAVKGLHDGTSEAIDAAEAAAAEGKLARKAPSGAAKSIGQDSFTGETPEGVVEVKVFNEDENGDDLVIAQDTMISLYFKANITGAKVADLAPHFEAARFRIDAEAAVSRDNTAGCWYACLRKAAAEEIVAIARAAGYAADLTAADHTGAPVGYKDQVVDVDAPQETPIRPWNARAAEYNALSPEEQEKNRKEWKGDEFVVALDYNLAAGNILIVAPRSYYEDHGTMYPEDIDILHMLPASTTKLAPWRFQSQSYDENGFDFEICNRRKFLKPLMFQAYLNMEDLN